LEYWDHEVAVKKALRFILTLIVILTALVTITVVLFRLGIAGRYIVGWMGDYIGVELHGERVDFGLDGELRISGFSFGLPDEEPFFTADQIQISVSSAKEIFSTRQVEVNRIQLVSPNFTLQRDELGRWNIQPILELRRPDPEPVRQLPEIEIVDGTFNYISPDGRVITAPNIQFNSTMADNGKYAFTLSPSGNNKIEGFVDLESLEHEAVFAIEEAQSVFSPGIAELNEHARLLTEWRGRVISQQPFELEGALDLSSLSAEGVELAGRAEVEADKCGLSVLLGWFNIDARQRLSGRPFSTGDIRVENGILSYDYAAKKFALDDLDVAFNGGKVGVNGDFYTDRWLESSGRIDFKDIRVSEIFADFDEDVKAGGYLDFAPAADARALEPLKISLGMDISGGIFEAAKLGQITANAYVGKKRLITETFDIPVFDGLVQPWFSLTKREGEFFGHVICDVGDVDINMIVQSFKPNAEPVPGRINGTARVRGLGNIKTLSGNADFSLRGSDLMHTEIIGAVYNILNLRLVELEPTGRGHISLAFAGDDIEIRDFEYFNRGVEVLGAGFVRSVSLGMDAPIDGVATGSLRPLRDTGVPGGKELDRLLQGLQVGFTSVKVEGTVGKTSTRVVPLPEVSGAIRNLLGQ